MKKNKTITGALLLMTGGAIGYVVHSIRISNKIKSFINTMEESRLRHSKHYFTKEKECDEDCENCLYTEDDENHWEDEIGFEGQKEFDLDEESKEQTEEEKLYQKAKEYVIEQQRASATMLQKKFEINWYEANNIIKKMEQENIVEKLPPKEYRARSVLISKSKR